MTWLLCAVLTSRWLLTLRARLGLYPGPYPREELAEAFRNSLPVALGRD